MLGLCRAREEAPFAEDERVLKEVERMPWFFGLDQAPPEEMTGEELVRVINSQGGLGSTDIVLGT